MSGPAPAAPAHEPASLRRTAGLLRSLGGASANPGRIGTGNEPQGGQPATAVGAESEATAFWQELPARMAPLTHSNRPANCG